MKLVMGGAFQGKTQYAMERFDLLPEDITDGRTCEREAVFQTKMLTHFHEYVKRFLKEDGFLKALPQMLMEQNPGIIVITNELGYGVVPVEAFDRAWRETTGRLCCLLAKEATEVHRVVCGIGTVIKDA